MPEYINKKEALNRICAEKCGNYGYEECAAPKRCLECQIIEEFEAADVAPVVHGRWISYVDGIIICTACNGKLFMSKTQFCPLCGARMDKKL